MEKVEPSLKGLPLSFPLIGDHLVPWPHPTSRKAGKYSMAGKPLALLQIYFHERRKEWILWAISGFCHCVLGEFSTDLLGPEFLCTMLS